MHIKAYTYDEFTYFDDLVYEISKKMILEKVIMLSFIQQRLFIFPFAISPSPPRSDSLKQKT